jgi:hypothetical protein
MPCSTGNNSLEIASCLQLCVYVCIISFSIISFNHAVLGFYYTPRLQPFQCLFGTMAAARRRLAAPAAQPLAAAMLTVSGPYSLDAAAHVKGSTSVVVHLNCSYILLNQHGWFYVFVWYIFHVLHVSQIDL